MTTINQIQSRTLASTAKVNALREPHKRVILQVKGGEELRPLFGRTLMASVLDKAFKGGL